MPPVKKNRSVAGRDLTGLHGLDGAFGRSQDHRYRPGLHLLARCFLFLAETEHDRGTDQVVVFANLAFEIAFV